MATPYQETPIREPLVPETPVTPTEQTPPETRKTVAWGVGLIGLGLFFFAAQIFDLGILVLPVLALAFIAWGIVTREEGLFIPGGIFLGIALGIVAMDLSLVSDEMQGGVFLLAFALGWVSISVLTALFGEETHWWALIPAAIMALVGATVLIGGVFGTALTLLGTFWPLVLIAIGVAILLRRQR